MYVGPFVKRFQKRRYGPKTAIIVWITDDPSNRRGYMNVIDCPMSKLNFPLIDILTMDKKSTRDSVKVRRFLSILEDDLGDWEELSPKESTTKYPLKDTYNVCKHVVIYDYGERIPLPPPPPPPPLLEEEEEVVLRGKAIIDAIQKIANDPVMGKLLASATTSKKKEEGKKRSSSSSSSSSFSSEDSNGNGKKRRRKKTNSPSLFKKSGETVLTVETDKVKGSDDDEIFLFLG